MALAKSTQTFQLRGGVSTKEDPKAVPAAKLLVLQNATFQSPGRLRKRNGFMSNGRRVAATGALLEDGQALLGYRDELLACDPTKIYSYDAGSNQWIDKGHTQSCSVEKASVSAGTYSVGYQDSATHPNGLQAFAWLGGSNTLSLYYSIVDGNTGQTVVAQTLISATAYTARVLCVNNVFVFYYYNTSTHLLYAAALPVATPTASLTFTALTSAIADANSVNTSNPVFDAVVIDSPAVGKQIYLAFNNRLASGGTSLWRFSAATPTTAAAHGKISIVGERSYSMGLFEDVNLHRVVLAYYTNVAVMFRTYEPALCDASDVPQIVAFGIVETLAGVVNITGASLACDPVASVAATATVSTVNGEDYATATIGGHSVTVDASQLIGLSVAGDHSVTRRWLTSDIDAAGDLANHMSSFTTVGSIWSPGQNTFIVEAQASGVGGNSIVVVVSGTGVSVTPMTGGAPGVHATCTVTIDDARGYTDAEVATNLAAAVEVDPDAGPLASATSSSATVTLVSRLAGALGNATSLSVAGPNVTASGATFEGGVNASQPTDVRFFYTRRLSDLYDATLENTYVRTAGITGEYSVSAYWLMMGSPFCEITIAPSDWLRSVALSSRAWVYSGQIYVGACFMSALQAAYFVGDADRNIVARMMPGSAGQISGVVALTRARLAAVNAIDSTTFSIALLEKHAGGNGTGEDAFAPGVSRVALDFFEPEISYRRAELASNLHVGGGFLAMYDGVSVVEHGFFVFPERVQQLSAAGGRTYVYEYRYCYEWTDNVGQVHRSDPSPALSFGADNVISASHPASIAVDTLRLTAKQSDFLATARAPVRLVGYRTEAAGTVLRRCSLGTTYVNDPTVDYVVVADESTDAEILEAAEIYTTGDVYENDCAPACTSVVTHGARVFVLDAENPLVVWASQEVVAPQAGGIGAPVEFSQSLSFGLPPAGGVGTGLASLDDKLICFKRAALLAVTGRGPDSTGANNDWSSPQFITSACGCSNMRSVVSTPAGLIFQSLKGFWMLDRSLVATYIGADVEAFNDEQVTSAVLLENTNQVRFTLGNGTALVFDYFVGQWAVFTNVAAVDSIIWNGQHTYLRENGAVLSETPGVFTDDGSHVPMGFTSAWLQFAGPQGYQRVREMLLLGEYLGPHKLQISVAYDFDPAIKQTVLLTPNAPASYGGDSPYGSGSPYGGTFPEYQWRLGFNKQKTGALQISVVDVPNGAPGESMSLSALSFEVASKHRMRPTPASRSA